VVHPPLLGGGDIVVAVLETKAELVAANITTTTVDRHVQNIVMRLLLQR
jgi:hypothetical protein